MCATLILHMYSAVQPCACSGEDYLTVYRVIQEPLSSVTDISPGRVPSVSAPLTLLTPEGAISLICSSPFLYHLPPTSSSYKTHCVCTSPQHQLWSFIYKFMDAVGSTDCNHYFQVGPQEPNFPDPGRSQQDAVSMKRNMLLSEQAVGVEPS